MSFSLMVTVFSTAAWVGLFSLLREALKAEESSCSFVRACPHRVFMLVVAAPPAKVKVSNSLTLCTFAVLPPGGPKPAPPSPVLELWRPQSLSKASEAAGGTKELHALLCEVVTFFFNYR